MIGANVNAGQSANLTANGNINLQAAESNIEVHSSNSGSNASIGATFALGGQQNGFSFQLGAQGNRGLANGSETSYTNTQIKVGGTDHPGSLVIHSGGDTTLKGANASADKISTDIGGNLWIESLKDKLTYDSQQTSSGAGVSICIPPICYGTFVTVNVNASEAKIQADHDSVGGNDAANQAGQSGLMAGNGGFNVNVKGDTTLIGGVISSTQAAINSQANRFSTGGSLTTQDIQNHSELDASSFSVNVSVSSGGTSASGANINGSSGGAFGYGTVSESEGSTTKAGISGIAGNQAVRTGDAEAGIKPVFAMTDVNQINRSLTVQTMVTAEFNENTIEAVTEAYRVMFKTKPTYYKITCVKEPCTYDPKAGGNPNENIRAVEITPEEMKRLGEAIKNGEMAQGKIVLAVNGILNGQAGNTDRAGQLAMQNAANNERDRSVEYGETKPTVILLHYPEANNFISEMMVAGYEKFLAGKLDYTNYDKSYANTTKELAPYGLSSEGHSRGTLVQENAFEILGNEGWTAPADMSVQMRGGRRSTRLKLQMLSHLLE